jgi:glycosyltransferase involved in cell wall biosynthesis
MHTVVFVVPGRLETRTGGYEYDRRMIAGLRARGWTVDVRELHGSFPHPTPAALDHAARVLADIPDSTTVVVDGLAFGAMPGEVEREARRLRLVALVHMPLAFEIGIHRDTAGRLQINERRALAAAALVIVTGKITMSAMEAGYGVEQDRVTVVEPGTDRAPLARGSGGPMVELLSVATVNAGKGYEILFRALAPLQAPDWHLTCAGSLERDPTTVERLRAQLHADGLQDRVSLVGELNESALSASYDRADVLVSASLRETYGMAVAEALARGLPVVATTTGAAPDLVVGLPSDSEDPHKRTAGILVPPGDVQMLRVALETMVADKDRRERFASIARRVRERLPTWNDASSKMAAALEQVATDGRLPL